MAINFVFLILQISFFKVLNSLLSLVLVKQTEHPLKCLPNVQNIYYLKLVTNQGSQLTKTEMLFCGDFF